MVQPFYWTDDGSYCRFRTLYRQQYGLLYISMNGQAGWGGPLYNWVVVWTANFVGSVLLVYIIFMEDFGVLNQISCSWYKALGIAQAKMS